MSPEAELEENFRSPVVSGPYLWSANPESNRIARIDARNFEVQVVDGGHAPTFLAPLPKGANGSGALVLNILGKDASVFRDSDGDGGMGGAGAELISEFRFDVHDGASAWAVGKSGAVAMAWSRFEEDLRGPLDGYQDLSVVFLSGSEPEVTRLSVGFRPTDVVINDDETRAYVVSDPGISVVELAQGAPRVVRELFLPDGGDGRARDVSFTPDGTLALVRLSQRAEVLLIDTENDRRVTVALPDEVTDLDLSGDGSLAVAVMRGKRSPGAPALDGEGGQGGSSGQASPYASHIALLPVPQIFEVPDQYQLLFTEELVGSTVIAHDASVALFFTSAVANSHLTMLDLESESFRTVDLQAPTQAAFISDDGRYAAAVMTPPVGSGRSGAFALVPVFDDLPLRIEGTSTVPRFISLQEDRVFVTTWGSSSAPAASFLGKFPELLVDRVELPSEPLASGILLEARQAFVAQAHSEGRVTFIGLDDSSPMTVTGFELASKVVEE